MRHPYDNSSRSHSSRAASPCPRTERGSGLGSGVLRRAAASLHVQEGLLAVHGPRRFLCTIIYSNLDALKVGSRIVYLQASAADGSIDSDIVIHVGPGSTIFGHCMVSASNTGVCKLSGGTGPFTHFHAREAVALVSGTIYSWDGPYSFGPPE